MNCPNAKSGHVNVNNTSSQPLEIKWRLWHNLLYSIDAPWTVPNKSTVGLVAFMCSFCFSHYPTKNSFVHEFTHKEPVFIVTSLNRAQSSHSFWTTNRVKNCVFFFVPGLTRVSPISTQPKTVERLVWSEGPPITHIVYVCIPATLNATKRHLAVSVVRCLVQKWNVNKINKINISDSNTVCTGLPMYIYTLPVLCSRWKGFSRIDQTASIQWRIQLWAVWAAAPLLTKI